ncbi:signal recognition particle-docking protein FtsY [Salinigranum marinum]|uniref:signal recognition particle-docking protein FtsY n=1 Tax=Salinigranum marinum TaxID=1515595 RepID=UPI002989FEA2|nr:signal recognition particle-docking protein FtsY [Salinigranum marinum]
MFDGLKDKLNSFRKDVEETAEEKAEEKADSESESSADAEAEAGVDTAADTPTGTTAGGETPASQPETEPGTDAAASTEPTESDGTGDDATVDAEETESGTEPGAESDSGREPVTAETEAESDDGVDSSDVGSGATDVPDDVDLSDETLAAEGVESAVEAAAGSEQQSASTFQRAKAFATGRIIIEEEDLEEPLWQLEMALLESDVEMNVAEAILETIREKMIGESRKQVDTTAELVSEALSDALLEVISVGQFDFDERVQEADKPVTLIFTGVNGVGKTTSIAKLARYFEARGLSTVLANGDTYRAGANEQIQRHADNLGKKLISHDQGGDPAAVIYDAVEYAEAHGIDVVLGDTAGRLHTSNDLMAQLEKIDRVVDPDMTLFVDEAVAGQDAVQRAKKFDEAAEIDGAILTKADADSQGGAAISIAYVTGKPILFLGVGQGYDDLTRFDPEELVASLLGDE